METWSARGSFGLVGTGCLLVAGLATPAAGQATSRSSVNTAGVQGNFNSYVATVEADRSISGDGRYVVFESQSTNLVAGDTNGTFDVFVRDLQVGTTERVSVDSAGAQGNGASRQPSISADGRYVAFESAADNLVLLDTNGVKDIFVRDLQTDATERVSVDSDEVQGGSGCTRPSISGDGRYVAFVSSSMNLVAGDANAAEDVFVRDRQDGTTELVSVDSAEAQGNGHSSAPCISADGGYVAFCGQATNLVVGDTNSALDVFVRDLQAGTTERVSVDSAGAQGNFDSDLPSISGDGRYVAFESSATNLVGSDTNGHRDAFFRDTQLDTTERVSVDSAGAQGDSQSSDPSVSADGRYVAFESIATNLIGGDTNAVGDIFLRDTQLDTTVRVSVDSVGTQALLGNFIPSISADGRYVVFASNAMNLVFGDTNGSTDIFVRDRAYSAFTSYCHPGTGGVIACPCANAPSGGGRGCNNSSNTGGAILAAAGGAYLSSDTLVFNTSDERPTALTILVQGPFQIVAGAVYGQGVRCVQGTLLRLFIRSAVGGSITVPNFGAGDPSISASSAAKGDTIPAGGNRRYFAFYRDPNVLGGCPTSSTFNTTGAVRVTWAP